MIFEPTDKPRVFALPVGVNFLEGFVQGLITSLSDAPPEEMARVEIYVNASRTRRELIECLSKTGALILPRIHLITDLTDDITAPVHLPQASTGLDRRLKLAQLVRALLDAQPDLGAKTSAFDLADSLANLLDEMQGEAVPFARFGDLVDDHLSGHWQRSLRFLQIIADHWEENTLTDQRDRQRKVAEAYRARWQETPPTHPVLVIASTGSRGETSLFMQAVSRLPNGAVILPGVDTDMPKKVEECIAAADGAIDHPQSPVIQFCKSLDLSLRELPVWSTVKPACRERNALISLALHPAPVTDDWRKLGPNLVKTVPAALKNLEILTAPTVLEEANAIALRLRKAVEDDQRVVLVSPDRVLTRRVTSALAKWGLVPDDSGGEPLHLTPPGIFLRLTAQLLDKAPSPSDLVSLLKHPLSGAKAGQYRLFARELELSVLRKGGPEIRWSDVYGWATEQNDPDAMAWATWLAGAFEMPATSGLQNLEFWFDRHLSLTNALAGGVKADPSELWQKKAGERAFSIIETLRKSAKAGGQVSADEYRAILHHLLRAEEVREPVEAHPLISIWGTLEARVQSADLVILAGLNEGVWPKQPDPDPWLSRGMRRAAGLLLPDRQTALSAHDFQQAIGAKHVMLSRAERDGEAPSIPSRWMVRLINLLSGLGPETKAELHACLERGAQYHRLSAELAQPGYTEPKAPRPAPCPPTDARPKSLSVTQIETLIRNPYEIYAKKTLNLRRLSPLGREADALLRGNVTHTILENFIERTTDGWPDDPSKLFMKAVREVLEQEVPWPATRRLWTARMGLIADWFTQTEAERRRDRQTIALERRGSVKLDTLDFRLSVIADRIDRMTDGRLAIYDYKSGEPPTAKMANEFQKQLYLEALIAAKGGFEDIAAARAGHLEFIGFGKNKSSTLLEATPEKDAEMEAGLIRLITLVLSEEYGFIARDRPQFDRIESDFDHLSRRGEWQDSDAPQKIQVP